MTDSEQNKADLEKQEEKNRAEEKLARKEKRRAEIRKFWTDILPKSINILVMILSLGLIAFISWDTFKGRDYLENNVYMTYQLVVCMFFLLEYFYRLIISHHKIRYFILALPFLFISIPYLNIIEHYNISISHEILVYLCFIPIVRGLFALVMVVSFVAKKMVTTVFMSYTLVMLPAVYMSALIFYVAEKGLNPGIKSFGYALWWAGMNFTTIGCNINPVTGTGMIISFLLSLMGIVMLPLFTVYAGDVLNVFATKSKNQK